MISFISLGTMRQRFREAVARIANTDNNLIARLPLFEKSLLPILSLASVLYSATSFVRRRLYHYGLLTPIRLPVPVVSVGNITWGGNGKTPMVEFLSSCFLHGGICPIILTRGYAGGDEARLLQNHFEGSCARVGVGPNRAAIARSILEEHGITDISEREQLAECIEPSFGEQLPIHHPRGHGKVGVVLLDDGMQHWQLARDLEIVMVNLITTWGNNQMVPRGPLRESLEELRRADVVVLHHADLVSNGKIQRVRDVLGQFMRPSSVVILSRMAPRRFFRLPRSGMDALYSQHIHKKSWPLVSLDVIKGAAVLCVSGVGCPESVSLALQQMGSCHVERMDYLDHHNFQAKELKDISVRYFELQQRFQGTAVLLVLTEKDYVRDPAIWTSLKGVDLLVLHSSLEILPAGGAFQSLKRMLRTSFKAR
ncbi:unnamed protein product [Calypogeia fissa]